MSRCPQPRPECLLRRYRLPGTRGSFKKKLVAAYKEQDLEQILTSVKDHVGVISNRA